MDMDKGAMLPRWSLARLGTFSTISYERFAGVVCGWGGNNALTRSDLWTAGTLENLLSGQCFPCQQDIHLHHAAAAPPPPPSLTTQPG